MTATLDPRESRAKESIETLRRRVEELEAEVRARDDFLSVVAHELRNPVAPVMLDVQRLIARARKAEGGSVAAGELVVRLSGLEQRCERFLATLDRLHDVSRIAAGRVDLALELVDFGVVVRTAAAGFERELAAAGSELRLACEPGVVGQWDRRRLEQICSNLLSNAIRYGAGKPIEVSLRAEPGRAVLLVRDHGVGIAQEDQLRIFERFAREERGVRGGGFGVGLFIVRTLCSAFGGHVRVQSRLGSGASFSVTLPRCGREGR